MENLLFLGVPKFWHITYSLIIMFLNIGTPNNHGTNGKVVMLGV